MEIKSMLEYNNAALEDVLYDNSCNGKCSCCGECCTALLYVTDKEKRIIHQYIKRNNIKEQKTNAPFTNITIDITCSFYNTKEHVCNIYPVRPKICQTFFCANEKESKEYRNFYLNNPKYKLTNFRLEFYS